MISFFTFVNIYIFNVSIIDKKQKKKKKNSLEYVRLKLTKKKEIHWIFESK